MLSFALTCGYQTSQTPKKAQETLWPDCSQLVREAESLHVPSDDNSYALPIPNDDLMARLREAFSMVGSVKRERKEKNTVSRLLEDLRMKKLIKEDLKEELDMHSDLDDSKTASAVRLLPLYPESLGTPL